ncbi:MAG: RDD family protein, partial [Deltaproteobacteria bacterium]|nr:RDD family protein [Deltaproteobacteria bacterium]
AEILKRAEQDHTRERPNADKTTRIAGTVADVLLFLLCYSLLTKLVSAIEIASLAEGSEPFFAGLARFVAFSVTAFFYFGVTTRYFGGTIGKQLLGLRVATAEGANPDMATCVLRELVFKYGLGALSAGIVPLLYISGIRSKPIHDQWLGTTVKRVRGKL